MIYTYPNITRIRTKSLALVILLLISSAGYATEQLVHDLDSIPDQPLGKMVYYLQEHGKPLGFTEAQLAFAQNNLIQGHSHVLTFGIGSSPVWIHLAVKNNHASIQQRKLLIGTSWLDNIQIYIRQRGTEHLQQYHAGDNYKFSERPEASRTFIFDVLLRPGITDIFARIETPDPMVIPVYLLTEQDANDLTRKNEISYGFIYGYLIALLAYNAMLFFGLRDLRYLLYAIYLGIITIANISYTGHGFMWLWPEAIEWQRWAQPLLMILYGSAGLIFALYFLEIKRYSYRVYHIVHGLILAFFIFFTLTFIFRTQGLALLTAFNFISIFVVLMLVLGVYGAINKNPSARYFLLAVFAGLMGAAISAVSTWGFIPFNNLTFRAVEIGMLIEATLLALALAYRFRFAQARQLLAEKLARIDPLTELNNRRSFYEKANGIWNAAERHNRKLSIITFDLDGFKSINDSFGHECGDIALIQTSKALLNTVRRSDIPARWGGEEFIVLLQDSDIKDATTFAERLRKNIAEINFVYDKKTITVSASFGVAERSTTDTKIDNVITKADKALYAAKSKGKNQVNIYSDHQQSVIQV